MPPVAVALSWFFWFKAAVFLLLGLNAYDALLWLVALVMIEINVLQHLGSGSPGVACAQERG
ncbi:MAG: hypothetical protein HYU77_03105 [Betaproteobacteria bacterium]|nr:hypothetical protein [Betaproteobacteria bacterium]